ncbi:response regulator transcription factor [Sediminibacterium sp.]|jgi:DNA-binding NarL/FixJ family response regulator|uniref:response regulator transcription factor n=1 Tax=Sediminibacterium sp. TaxID=1917865 RepID=UPI001B748CAF|nr:response regulator transcription factor [Sediminibacterium sp.]MBP7345557.1 response regulator transcription factor [Sediminibacterium sp.]MDP2419812.1 response regulator transcription factor [Sediminibacterium sp.]HPH37736.1 response regulator transcription factor [Sediminibacterium sp.]
MMSISIAIVDDKPINRQTVKDKLIDQIGILIVFEAKNGLDFLEKLKLASIKPDVVLMDLEMPEMNGIEAISIATAAYPSIKFIVLTVFEENDKIFEAIKAGASGYLLKEDSAIHIVDAINSVYEHNGIPMSPSIARKTLELLKNIPVKPITENKELTNTNSAGLSEREIEILKEMVSGKNYKAIGEKLFISPLTVRKHASHIYEKLHVNNRTQAINIAQKQKWI